jgi:hypothetical protein
MNSPKKWNAGVADETWKVIVCARDLSRVDDLLSALSYYLTDAGDDTQRGLSIVREMSGSTIIDALEAHKRTSLMSVQSALSKPPYDAAR